MMDDVVSQMQDVLTLAGLTSITINATKYVGYMLHEKAMNLIPQPE
jgi:hypothetical protein